MDHFAMDRAVDQMTQWAEEKLTAAIQRYNEAAQTVMNFSLSEGTEDEDDKTEGNDEDSATEKNSGSGVQKEFNAKTPDVSSFEADEFLRLKSWFLEQRKTSGDDPRGKALKSHLLSILQCPAATNRQRAQAADLTTSFNRLFEWENLGVHTLSICGKQPHRVRTVEDRAAIKGAFFLLAALSRNGMLHVSQLPAWCATLTTWFKKEDEAYYKGFSAETRTALESVRRELLPHCLWMLASSVRAEEKADSGDWVHIPIGLEFIVPNLMLMVQRINRMINDATRTSDQTREGAEAVLQDAELALSNLHTIDLAHLTRYDPTHGEASALLDCVSPLLRTLLDALKRVPRSSPLCLHRLILPVWQAVLQFHPLKRYSAPAPKFFTQPLLTVAQEYMSWILNVPWVQDQGPATGTVRSEIKMEAGEESVDPEYLPSDGLPLQLVVLLLTKQELDSLLQPLQKVRQWLQGTTNDTPPTPSQLTDALVNTMVLLSSFNRKDEMCRILDPLVLADRLDDDQMAAFITCIRFFTGAPSELSILTEHQLTLLWRTLTKTTLFKPSRRPYSGSKDEQPQEDRREFVARFQMIQAELGLGLLRSHPRRTTRWFSKELGRAGAGTSRDDRDAWAKLLLGEISVLPFDPWPATDRKFRFRCLTDMLGPECCDGGTSLLNLIQVCNGHLTPDLRNELKYDVSFGDPYEDPNWARCLTLLLQGGGSPDGLINYFREQKVPWVFNREPEEAFLNVFLRSNCVKTAECHRALLELYTDFLIADDRQVAMKRLFMCLCSLVQDCQPRCTPIPHRDDFPELELLESADFRETYQTYTIEESCAVHGLMYAYSSLAKLIPRMLHRECWRETDDHDVSVEEEEEDDTSSAVGKLEDEGEGSRADELPEITLLDAEIDALMEAVLEKQSQWFPPLVNEVGTIPLVSAILQRRAWNDDGGQQQTAISNVGNTIFGSLKDPGHRYYFSDYCEETYEQFYKRECRENVLEPYTQILQHLPDNSMSVEHFDTCFKIARNHWSTSPNHFFTELVRVIPGAAKMLLDIFSKEQEIAFGYPSGLGLLDSCLRTLSVKELTSFMPGIDVRESSPGFSLVFSRCLLEREEASSNGEKFFDMIEGLVESMPIFGTLPNWPSNSSSDDDLWPTYFRDVDDGATRPDKSLYTEIRANKTRDEKNLARTRLVTLPILQRQVREKLSKLQANLQEKEAESVKVGEKRERRSTDADSNDADGTPATKRRRGEV